jgi:divalent metal cation (Fe/Co/Zn/Cd) transporter
MRGSIRFFVGLIVTLGAVGYIEQLDSVLLNGIVTAGVGLILMYSGVTAMKENV